MDDFMAAAIAEAKQGFFAVWHSIGSVQERRNYRQILQQARTNIDPSLTLKLDSAPMLG